MRLIWRAWFQGVLFGIIFFGLCSQPWARSRQTRELTVLFSTDLYGQYIQASCKKPPEADFSNLVGAIRRVQRELEQAAKPQALVLNGGDNIGPRAIARFLLSQGESGATLISSWLKRAGTDLLVLGNDDFFAVSSRLEAYLKAVRKAELTFSVANLDCDDASQGICAYLSSERFVMFDRAGLKIAIFGLIQGDLGASLNASQSRGFQIVDPLERAQEVIASARHAGADLVFVVSHVERQEHTPDTTLTLAQALPDADLVIANAFGFAQSQRRVEAIHFADGRSPIVGCDALGHQLCRADLRVVRQSGRWQVAQLRSTAFDITHEPPDKKVKKEVRQALAEYCRDWAQPVGQGKLANPMDAWEFLDYLLEIMRTVTHSELAFANRGLIDPTSVFPITKNISRHDFFAGLPHRNKLYTFSMTGAELSVLCDKMAKQQKPKQRLVARGLVCGEQPLVNGRPMLPADRYSAVTIEYLAQGVAGYFSDPKLRMQLYQPQAEVQSEPVLGEIARSFLGGSHFVGPSPWPIDLNSNFADLSRKLRWRFQGGLLLNLSDVRLSNPRVYTQSQLTRDEFVALKGELRLLVEADSLLHGLVLDSRIKYARSSTENAAWIESEDLTTIKAIYKSMALRDGTSGFYVPIPYLEANLETELTKPEDRPETTDVDEGRDYHHLELTAALGSRFALFAGMEAKLGLGLQKELLNDQAQVVLGVDVGYRLAKTDLFQILSSPLQMESELSTFFADIGRTNTLKGTWTNRLYFALVGPIYFNVTHELFLYRYSTWDYGIASDLTLGLSLSTQATVQMF